MRNLIVLVAFAVIVSIPVPATAQQQVQPPESALSFIASMCVPFINDLPMLNECMAFFLSPSPQGGGDSWTATTDALIRLSKESERALPDKLGDREE